MLSNIPMREFFLWGAKKNHNYSSFRTSKLYASQSTKQLLKRKEKKRK